MKKFLLLITLFFLLCNYSKSQSCIPTTINGSIVNLACGQACTSFSYQVPHLRSTTDYILTTIAYNPLPYVVALGGSEDPNLYNDDQFSSLINLPFTFCFYGANYNSVVVGSNGLISFDATNQSCANAYTIGPTIPYTGGSQCQQFSTYYPKAAIMAAYADLDPRTNPPASPQDRKIQWRIEGTSPCRKFVASYYHIGVYGQTSPNGCGYVTPSTFQIIIYESTGLVDIFFQNKSCLSTTNSGRSILGIQDYNPPRAVAAPGKNATVWDASNEGYRFVPNGGTSNYVSAQLFTLTGTFIANADTATTTAGLLDISFPNICPPLVSTTQYVIRTTFNSCASTPLISSDTVTFNRITYLPVNASQVNTTCGVSTGSITVTPTAGTSPYTYTLNGGSTVTVPGGHTYNNLAAGPYVVVVSDANGCDTTLNFTINTTATISATVASTATTCPLSTNGTITVNPTSGTAPYMFSLDGGTPQASNIFTNVPAGPHTVTFIDVMSCTGLVNVNVAAGSTTLTANTVIVQTSCPLATDGSITVNPTNGTAPYSYSLDGGAPQASNVFNNVTPGPHTITLRDAVNGCVGSFNVNVPAGSTPLAASVTSTSTTCPTLNDGTITVTPSSGTPPYQYRLDGGLPQGSNVFTNVAAGAHNVQITDAFGCTGTFSINVVQGTSLTSSVNSTNPPCNNINNGSITITPTSGTSPYMYSLNGGTPQAGNTFPGLAPGTYNISFTDANACTGTASVTLTTNPAITATATLTNPLCKGNNTGSIILIPTGGVSPYQYSINASPYQTSPAFNNLTAGTYNFLIKDAVGCIYNFIFTLTEPALLTAFATPSSATCPNNDGSIDIIAGGGTPGYEYSIDNGVNWQMASQFPNLPIGTYNNIKVRDVNGCISSAAPKIITLNDTMRLELGADSTICFGGSITLIPETNAQTDTFKWTPKPTLNYDTVKTPIATPNDTTKYYLTAKWGVCNRKDSIVVNVKHKPVANAGKDTTVCYKTNATLFGSASNLSGTVNFAWSPPDSLNNPNSAVTGVRLDTTRQFVLTVTDNYGCNFSVTDSVIVFMQPELYAFAGNDTIAIINRDHQLMATGRNAVDFVWSPMAPLNNPFIANPVAVLNHDTYFFVHITDAIGCTDDDTIFIKVYEGPTYYLPNAFSPNGDGLNDIFFPTPVGIRSTDYFRVFDRYGALMYQTNQWLKGWDGTLKGKKASSGTYVWMIKGIDKNGSVIEMKGTVILLR